ncbi:spirocyclase AveC family protein [Streptomyces sp. NPDC013455]|uniref:spirocyclase AveC family protein n=1 Tax=Streptomyces sp. NPDC013455 TaxID=3155605 RepID=UPI003404CC0E
MTQQLPPHGRAAVTAGVTQVTADQDRTRPVVRRPVLGWAAAGAAFLALQTYVFVRWAADGGYRLVDVPGGGGGQLGHRRIVDVLLPATSVAGVLVLGFWLVRRSLAERRLSFDALLFTGVVLAGWLSPLMNWFHPVLIANTHVLGSVGSWGPYVPGWRGLPPGQEAELPLVTFSLCSTVLLGVLGCCHVMARVRGRWPGVRAWQLVGAAFLTAVAFDLSEPFISFAGVSVWSRALPAVTLWSGAWYQFPLYQLLGTGLASGSLSALRFFRDERDETLVERGAWRLPGRVRPWVRFLAVVGAVNAVMLGYSVLQAALSLIGGQPPGALPDFFGPPAAY